MVSKVLPFLQSVKSPHAQGSPSLRQSPPRGRVAHLKPVPVMDVAPDVGGIGANGQLECGPQCKPAPLHSEGHEARAQHGRPHVEVQVGHWYVGLPASREG